ncbi:MAG: UDP-N-acetylmuramate dehydrogenase [Clostridia bacterium]|nr:UDP-N-acetylmuramate dehydrogenase [Clostridia bacterium]
MFQKLLNVCANENILINEPMKNYTTFRTGGPADFLVFPETKEQLKEILLLVKTENVPLTIIGNGSNLLVSDKGIRGVVVCTCKMKEVYANGTEIVASCGTSMAALSACAKQASLTGLEFASGIPGTVGGGIVMNAGAYDGCLADCATETLCMDLNGNEKRFCGEEQQFGYRKSAFLDGEWIVLESKFRLTPGNMQEIEDKMKELNARRKEKQPLEKPSAGSTFKRPEGYFAGKLIQDADLKGYRAGGACVSEKHAGFVVNDQNGTTADVLAVIRHCQETVLQKFGIQMETEVRIIGEF